MAEQKINTLNTRIQHKIDTEARWDEAEWTPLDGELLVYRNDNDVQIKFGDGVKIPKDLPFAIADSIPEDFINGLFPTKSSQ